MAEIGLVASVIAVTGAALAVSKTLCEMVDEVVHAPVEVSAISRDAHAFDFVVTSIRLGESFRASTHLPGA